MKILLHICCAPCSIYPLKILREDFSHVLGYFYTNNIHPYAECLIRQNTLSNFINSLPIKIIYQNEYKLGSFIRGIVYREHNRCYYCYYNRIMSTAIIAKKGNFDCFSTTLLYSLFQNHKLLRLIGKSIGKILNIPFYYRDFRQGWKEGLFQSKKIGLYRQSYCGCLYSEKEKYLKKKNPLCFNI